MSEDAAATLAAIRERAEAAANYTTGDWAEISARDVPILLAAVEAVLKRHAPILDDPSWCRECGHSFPCVTLRAITAALAGTGKEGSDE